MMDHEVRNHLDFFEVFLKSFFQFDKFSFEKLHNNHQFPEGFLDLHSQLLLNNLDPVQISESAYSHLQNRALLCAKFFYNIFLSFRNCVGDGPDVNASYLRAQKTLKFQNTQACLSD